MDRLQEIIGDYETFVGELVAEVVEAGFDRADLAILDHICYRVPTTGQYKTKKEELAEVATLLTETTVNHRPIATLKLHKPIRADGWRVDAIELPAPKPGREETEGLEHGEFVIYDTVDEFIAKYDHLDLETKAADRGVNPEIGYRLDSGKGVKFHILPLTAVVQLEDLLGVREVKDGVSGMG